MSTLITPNRSTNAGRTRPSVAGYWTAGALAVIGMLATAIWAVVAFLGYVNHVDGFTRINAPGATVMSIGHPGTYYVYYEHPRGTTPADLGVTVTDPAGRPIALNRVAFDMTYDVPGHHGQVGTAIAQFRADLAGGYRVTVDRAAPDATVAIGANLVSFAVPYILAAAGTLLLTWGGAVALTVVTAVRRARVPSTG